MFVGGGFKFQVQRVDEGTIARDLGGSPILYRVW